MSFDRDFILVKGQISGGRKREIISKKGEEVETVSLYLSIRH